MFKISAAGIVSVHGSCAPRSRDGGGQKITSRFKTWLEPGPAEPCHGAYGRPRSCAHVGRRRPGLLSWGIYDPKGWESGQPTRFSIQFLQNLNIPNFALLLVIKHFSIISG